MKKFTKLALASSIAFSANAMAMQALDDTAMSATTGQDGINIGIGISKVTIDKVYVHDNDGLAAGATYGYTGVNATTNPPTVTGTAATPIVGGTGAAGALAIDGITITANYNSILSTGNLMDLKIDSDAGTGADGAFLNIAAAVSGLVIDIGDISVAKSWGNATSGYTRDGIRRGVVDNSSNKILSGFSITTGQLAANVQLGATPQGAMILLDTTMEGGLTISDLGILDNVGGGQVTLGKIQIADEESTDLGIEAKVSVTTDGLVITSVKDATNHVGTDIYIQGINLGAAPTVALGARGTARTGSIGDVEVQGLRTFYKVNGTEYAEIGRAHV